MSSANVLDGVSVGEKYLLYKGRPLVREKNIISYGCVEEKYILQLTIMTTKEYDGKEVPDRVLVQVLNTDQSLPVHERIAKQDMGCTMPLISASFGLSGFSQRKAAQKNPTV